MIRPFLPPAPPPRAATHFSLDPLGVLPKLDVSVPRAPFLLMWSPNSQSLTYLSNSEGPDGPTIRLAEVLVAAAKTPFKTKCKAQTYIEESCLLLL